MQSNNNSQLPSVDWVNTVTHTEIGKDEKIIIVALRIHRGTLDKINMSNLQKFEALTSAERLQFVVDHISEASEKLSKQYPNHMIIYSLNEYFLQSSSSAFQSDQILKKSFKQTLSDLSKKFPNIVIIAGTLLTQKTFNDKAMIKERLKLIKSAYDHVQIYHQTPDLTDEERTALKELTNEVANLQSLIVVRNTCYVFQDGEIIFRHDKTSAKGERGRAKIDHPHVIFQPGKKGKKHDTSLTHFKMKHFKTKNPITCHIEICLEHQAGVVLKQEDLHSPAGLIHFVLSDWTSINPYALVGKVAVHSDSFFMTKLFMLDADPMPNLQFYVCDLMEADSKALIGPLAPVYPLEIQVVNLMKTLLRQLSAFKDSATMDRCKEILDEFVKKRQGSSDKLKYTTELDKNVKALLSELTKLTDATGDQDKNTMKLLEKAKVDIASALKAYREIYESAFSKIDVLDEKYPPILKSPPKK